MKRQSRSLATDINGLLDDIAVEKVNTFTQGLREYFKTNKPGNTASWFKTKLGDEAESAVGGSGRDTSRTSPGNSRCTTMAISKAIRDRIQSVKNTESHAAVAAARVRRAQ